MFSHSLNVPLVFFFQKNEQNCSLKREKKSSEMVSRSREPCHEALCFRLSLPDRNHYMDGATRTEQSVNMNNNLCSIWF